LAMPIFAHVLPDFRFGPFSWGPATAIWPGLCIVWILGCLAAFACPRRSRQFAMVCIAATVITKVLLPIAPWGLPSTFWLFVLLAVPALLAARTPSRWSNRYSALLAGGLVLGMLIAASVLDPLGFSDGGPFAYTTFGRCAPWVAVTLIVCSAALLVAREWVNGFALALLAGPWLLLPVVPNVPYAHSTATSPLAIATACAIGVALLAAWISDLWRTHRTLP